MRGAAWTQRERCLDLCLALGRQFDRGGARRFRRALLVLAMNKRVDIYETDDGRVSIRYL